MIGFWSAGYYRPSGGPLSAEGAKCDSLGQRPRKRSRNQFTKPQRGEINVAPVADRQALNAVAIMLLLQSFNLFLDSVPRALPGAFACRAFGA